MTHALQETRKLGQSIWYDNMRRGLLVSGELARLIDDGVTGLTSNPTIFEKAIAGSADYDEALIELTRAGKDVVETYEALVIGDIQRAADLLRPIYDETGGADGYASLEVSPNLAYETEETVEEALRLFAALERPNVMIKVPGTPQGIPAVRRLISKGININTTLIFSLEAYRQVAEAYVEGLEELAEQGGDVGKVGAVASFFLSRVDTLTDKLLQERVDAGNSDAALVQGKAAIANARMAYHMFQELFEGPRFAELREKGAKPQRPLWASTSTKNPAYDELMYVESLIGPNTVNTLPPATLTAYAESGVVRPTLAGHVAEAEAALAAIDQAGVSMERVTQQLLDEGVKSFADSFDSLIRNIAEKRERLRAHSAASPLDGLGDLKTDVEATLRRMAGDRTVPRIWDRDHTVWKQDPAEIADRLGWLQVTERMSKQVSSLESFAQEVRDEGIRHVVLLGMGGSSLGPEVLRQTFGSAEGYPELIVLDSTIPAAVRHVTDAIDPARTLFLVSSKSGSTIEVMSLYKHFRRLVEETVGADSAGRHFVAITDAGTPLERLAADRGFRRSFLNPSDVGGRYSVLSYFGLTPAALMGLDVAMLLQRADGARDAAHEQGEANPAAWLGAAMGTLAQNGRDKLTLVTSPAIAGFGLWVEQLVAESTGKEGKGVVPVAGEPLLEPAAYGNDRFFVYLRLDGDDNAQLDQAIERLESSGHPVARLALKDRYDLGGEFFRWEFATAVAGAILGIQPFDQPNVQQAKDLTAQVLASYEKEGRLPDVSATGSLRELLSGARPGDYLAIMAYVQETPAVVARLTDLRRAVMQRHGIATTLGFGPRFLHSTGQLHKGGPPTGLYVQIVADDAHDLPVPGETYSFGVLAAAQALGDLNALEALGRRVARVTLKGDVETGLASMAIE